MVNYEGCIMMNWSSFQSCFRILDWLRLNWLAECLGSLQLEQLPCPSWLLVLQPGSGHFHLDKSAASQQWRPDFGVSTDCCRRTSLEAVRELVEKQPTEHSVSCELPAALFSVCSPTPMSSTFARLPLIPTSDMYLPL